MSEENLYDMELHESIFFQKQCMQVLRVAGGWIYTNVGYEPITSCFVPFDTEFM